MLTTLALALTLLSSPAQADIIIHFGPPPRPQVHHQRQQQQGWAWVPRHRDHKGRMIPGHWQATQQRAGHTWVQGRRDHRGHWVSGHWTQRRDQHRDQRRR